MDFLYTTKTSTEMTDQERTEREARRAAIRERIMTDQATNAKRGKKALVAEARWFRNNGQGK